MLCSHLADGNLYNTFTFLGTETYIYGCSDPEITHKGGRLSPLKQAVHQVASQF